MRTVLHKADTRGKADHGWLQSRHTFSFAGYHDPNRMHFGALRVLNDDMVEGGMGFDTHPHQNMEIISIPLEGELEHKDSMGNTAVIREGDIQVMSAGTGVYHSEYNRNRDKPVKFLQIWIYPKTKGVSPRYDQVRLQKDKLNNRLYPVLSPEPREDAVWIHQDAWFHIGDLSYGSGVHYAFKRPGNGLYVFVIRGSVKVEDQELEERDGFGVWDTEEVRITSSDNSRVLLMEVPMN